MNILITGAFGFVGSFISKAFKDSGSYHLIAVDMQKPDYFDVYNDYYHWDQLNHINWKKIDGIIHLAALVHDTKNSADENMYFEVNLGITRIIFNYFLKSAATKFIFFSSVKAVADSVRAEKLTEDVSPNPKTPYGKSKLAAERYLLGQQLPPEKKVYILRPCMIHGPGNKGNLNLLYNIVQKSIPWPLGRFDNKRSFTSVENLVFILNEVLNKEIEPGIYNVADDEPISTNRLIELIAESEGRKPRIWGFNKKLIYQVAKTGDFIHLPLNTERLQKLTNSYVVSNNKIKNALGINKMPVTAEEGMRKTLRSFRNESME